MLITIDDAQAFFSRSLLLPVCCSPSNPRAPNPTSETSKQIQSITISDVQAFLSTWERPDSAVVGLVGDFDSRQVWWQLCGT